MVLSAFISLLFDRYLNSGDDRMIERKIVKKGGVIGCLSEAKYEELREYFRVNKKDKIQEMLKQKECFIYPEGEVVEGKKKFCPENGDMNEIKKFSTSRFFMGRIFLPCFAFYDLSSEPAIDSNKAQNVAR